MSGVAEAWCARFAGPELASAGYRPTSTHIQGTTHLKARGLNGVDSVGKVVALDIRRAEGHDPAPNTADVRPVRVDFDPTNLGEDIGPSVPVAVSRDTDTGKVRMGTRAVTWTRASSTRLEQADSRRRGLARHVVTYELTVRMASMDEVVTCEETGRTRRGRLRRAARPVPAGAARGRGGSVRRGWGDGPRPYRRRAAVGFDVGTGS